MRLPALRTESAAQLVEGLYVVVYEPPFGYGKPVPLCVCASVESALVAQEAASRLLYLSGRHGDVIVLGPDGCYVDAPE